MEEDVSRPALHDLDQLLREIHPRLIAFFRCRALPGLDAEDLAQETLLKVVTRYSEWKPSQGPSTAWLVRHRKKPADRIFPPPD